MDLDALHTAIADEDWVSALDEGLKAWRITRHPTLARIIDAVSARAADVFDAPRARGSEAFDAAWVEVARSNVSALATGWLAATLKSRIPHDGDQRNQHLHTRVTLLRGRCPDPRIASATVELLAKGTFTAWPLPQAMSLYAPLVELAQHHGDASLAEPVANAASAPRASRAVVRQALERQLPPLAEALRQMEPTDAVPELEHILHRLTPTSTYPSRDAAALLAHVLATPGDEMARAVLVDGWLADESPRGELVALQRSGVPQDDKRIKRLLRAHRKTWLGPDVASVLANAVFQDGLLHQATLRPTSSASKATWERVLTDPNMSTLRRFAIGRGSHTWYRKLVGAPILRDLRQVEVRTNALLELVLDGIDRPLERLDLRFVPSTHHLKQLANRFQGLSRVLLPIDADPTRMVDSLTTAGLAGRLDTLIFEEVPWYEGIRVEEWQRGIRQPTWASFSTIVDALPALKRFELTRNPYHYMLSLGFDKTEVGWVLTIRTNDWDRAPRVFMDGPHPIVLDPDPSLEWPRYLVAQAATTPAFAPLPEQVVAVRTVPAIDPAWRLRLEQGWGVPVDAAHPF